jgi:hypothetical protein
MLDQPPEQIEHILPARHLLRRFEGEPACEHRQASEQPPLGFPEQLVAPIQGTAHRALSLRQVARPAGLEGLI